jgi:hypothetical protein
MRDDAIATALAALKASPDGWLELPDRRRLRGAFGPWTAPDDGGPDAGLLRRAALYTASVERALPVWESAFPNDRRPHEIVAAVLPALRGERAEAEVDAIADALRRDVEPLGSDLERTAAFHAGAAAVALSWAAWDGDLDPELDPLDSTDRDLDEPPVDALAARAVAGEDPEARRAFWRWYISEAFPAAYAVVA